MGNKATSDVWWRNAVVYCLDVETFMDGNGDGIGDFRGLTQRIDYLAGLGVTCLWLLPFYPSPSRDDGYDITDFYSVDPRLGTLGDFVEFMRMTTERGIRVIADLVVNHTSHEHPWFQSARCDPNSPYRDWYVWADDPPRNPAGVVFPGVEDSIWNYDEAAGKYYLHRFYSSQPDLNITNTEVRDEINRIIGFWMELGLSGFRVDAVPFLIEDLGVAPGVGKTGGDPHSHLREIRRFLSRRRGDAAMLGEVDLEPEEQYAYFGAHGDELHLLFNFNLNQALFLALARRCAEPLVSYLNAMPAPPADCQWVNFVRNHDELNLSRLADDEREEVLSAYAPQQDMRAYGRGIRRRLPPMVEGNGGLIRCAYSLLLTLPGTPALLYGEEIGMGDDLSLDQRLSVRTLMQWADAPGAGFSSATRHPTVRPAVEEGPFSYRQVNVASQRRDPESLLSWMERAIRVRKECPEFGWGDCEIVDSGADAVLAHRCDWLDGTVLAIHNLASEPRDVKLDLGDGVESFTDVLADQEYPGLDAGDPGFRIGGCGYRWLRVRRSGAAVRFP